VVELQKKFDESAALLNKTWIQIEEMRLLQIQIEEARKRELQKIQPAEDNKRKTSN
jgi:hypothetical protein